MKDNDEPISVSLKYKIIIDGRLKGKFAEWLNGMVVNIVNQKIDTWHTIITVCVPDQAALRGVMNKLWDLNLTLISISLEDHGANIGGPDDDEIYITLK